MIKTIRAAIAALTAGLVLMTMTGCGGSSSGSGEQCGGGRDCGGS